jgi:hypothetical protein
MPDISDRASDRTLAGPVVDRSAFEVRGEVGAYRGPCTMEKNSLVGSGDVEHLAYLVGGVTHDVAKRDDDALPTGKCVDGGPDLHADLAGKKAAFG